MDVAYSSLIYWLSFSAVSLDVVYLLLLPCNDLKSTSVERGPGIYGLQHRLVVLYRQVIEAAKSRWRISSPTLAGRIGNSQGEVVSLPYFAHNWDAFTSIYVFYIPQLVLADLALNDPGRKTRTRPALASYPLDVLSCGDL